MAVKRIAFSIAMLLVVPVAFAQSDLGLPFLGDVFQSTYLNPTVRAEHTLSIGLPGLSSVSVQGIHNGFVPNSIAFWEGDSLVIDPKLLPDALRDQNMIFANAGVDLFHIRFKVYNWDFWFATRQNHEVSFFYPKDIFRLGIEGNAPLVGDKLDFTPLGLNASIYREYTFGLSAETDFWIFGGRVSLLQGLSNAYLKTNSLTMSIGEDMYAHAVDADATLYTSGVPIDFVEDEDSPFLVPDVNTDKFNNRDYLMDYALRFRNPGFALSGGVAYKFDKRTTFTFSFSDVGMISWSDSTVNINMRGNASFEGFDALSTLLYDRSFDTDSLLNEYLESFEDNSFSSSYTTWLSPKFYFSIQYKLARRTQLGLQVYTTINREVYPAFTAGVSQGFGRSFNLFASISLNQRSIRNFSYGFIIKPGPVQIYLIADNFIPIPLLSGMPPYVFPYPIDPMHLTNASLRLGVNFVFGRVKTQQGLPYR